MRFIRNTLSSATPKHVLALALTSFFLPGFLSSTASAQHRDRDLNPAVHSVKSPVQWKAPLVRRSVVRPKGIAARPGILAPRRRIFGSLSVYRPYGPTIYGYGFHDTDAQAARWLAFTAITLAALDQMDEEQLRYHEQAQIEATNAPLGEAIIWQNGSAAGSVTALREGVDASGYTCREFQHSVMIGGQSETAYGTACLQADGAWKIVS